MCILISLVFPEVIECHFFSPTSTHTSLQLRVASVVLIFLIPDVSQLPRFSFAVILFSLLNLYAYGFETLFFVFLVNFKIANVSTSITVAALFFALFIICSRLWIDCHAGFLSYFHLCRIMHHKHPHSWLALFDASCGLIFDHIKNNDLKK